MLRKAGKRCASEKTQYRSYICVPTIRRKSTSPRISNTCYKHRISKEITFDPGSCVMWPSACGSDNFWLLLSCQHNGDCNGRLLAAAFFSPLPPNTIQHLGLLLQLPVPSYTSGSRSLSALQKIDIPPINHILHNSHHQLMYPIVPINEWTLENQEGFSELTSQGCYHQHSGSNTKALWHKRGGLSGSKIPRYWAIADLLQVLSLPLQILSYLSYIHHKHSLEILCKQGTGNGLSCWWPAKPIRYYLSLDSCAESNDYSIIKGSFYTQSTLDVDLCCKVKKKSIGSVFRRLPFSLNQLVITLIKITAFLKFNCAYSVWQLVLSGEASWILRKHVHKKQIKKTTLKQLQSWLARLQLAWEIRATNNHIFKTVSFFGNLLFW